MSVLEDPLENQKKIEMKAIKIDKHTKIRMTVDCFIKNKTNKREPVKKKNKDIKSVNFRGLYIL